MAGLLNAFIFVHIMSADIKLFTYIDDARSNTCQIVKFVCSSGELVCRMWRFSLVGFYNGSYQEDIKFVLW
jgi:hypothetical protein